MNNDNKILIIYKPDFYGFFLLNKCKQQNFCFFIKFLYGKDILT